MEVRHILASYPSYREMAERGNDVQSTESLAVVEGTGAAKIDTLLQIQGEKRSNRLFADCSATDRCLQSWVFAVSDTCQKLQSFLPSLLNSRGPIGPDRQPSPSLVQRGCVIRKHE